MEANAVLVIEIGEPYESGHTILLDKDTTKIGRNWQDQTPDIAFEDSRISRQHAEILCHDGKYEIRDLPTSKNGIEINSTPLEKNVSYKLKNNDCIIIAKGAAVLRFGCKEDQGITQTITSELAEQLARRIETQKTVAYSNELVLDIARREVLLKGKELRPRVRGYEYELLVVLYNNRGKAVSHEEIVNWVWRDLPSRDTIMRQNVATLVHRLRDCLGEYGKLIVNMPAYGYRMD
jgi:DNA-binding winged helix-turn-helix (wHTH) protein